MIMGKASVRSPRYGDVDQAEAALREHQAVAAKHPNDPTQQRKLAKLYDDAGSASGENGLGTQARMYFAAAFELRRQLAEASPDSLDLRSDLAASEESMGRFERGWNSPADALPHFDAALRAREQLVARKPERLDWQLDLARSYQLVGRVQQAQGQLDQALESYQASLRVGKASIKTSYYGLCAELRLLQRRSER